jgi:N utilization substance protein A
VIQYSDETKEYIGHALSPAKILRVDLNEVDKKATVFVAPEQFSLAIGRSGQNVRLASELTGWSIDVQQEGGTPAVAEESKEEVTGEVAQTEEVTAIQE